MSQMKDAVRERKQKEQMNEMLTGANQSVTLSEQQKELHYNEMMRYVERGDYKKAQRHARMYQFMDTLTNVSREFADLIADQQAIQESFGTIQKMNKNFKTFCRLTGESITTKSVKNLRKFGKMMARFDRDMDRMMASFDNMFEPKKKKPKKGAPAEPEQSDEEKFFAMIGGNDELRARFNGESGGNVQPAEKPSQSGSSDSGHGGHGGPSFGVGSPDD